MTSLRVLGGQHVTAVTDTVLPVGKVLPQQMLRVLIARKRTL